MSKIRLEMNQQELLRMYREPGGQTWFIVNRYGQRVQDRAKQLCPVDQGGLKLSITSELRNEGGQPVAYVGSNLPYAVYVHEGTGLYAKKNPKLIVPVRAKALKWPVKNNSGSGRRRYKGGVTAAYVYSKSSKGSPGRPFLLNALKQIMPTRVV